MNPRDIGCHYFPPNLRLLSQPDVGLTQPKKSPFQFSRSIFRHENDRRKRNEKHRYNE